MNGDPRPDTAPDCSVCGGDGATGMQPDGQPIICRHCDGSGDEPPEPDAPYEIDTSAGWPLRPFTMLDKDDPGRYRP